MSTSTKTRRRDQAAAAVVMSTPPPPSRTKSKYSEGEKQGLLQNYDLEVADKTQLFRSILARTLVSFRMREESEILSIPRELRKMTLGQLEDKWGGGWAGTLQRIRRESFEAREKVREEKEEKEREEVVKGKRKRNTATANNSPDRQSKNPRRVDPPPSSALRKSTRTAPSSAARGKPAPKNKVVPGTSAQGPSSLPQNHIFNPSLPPTTFRAAPSPLSKSSGPSRSKPSTSGPRNQHSRAESSSSRPPSDSENESGGSDADSDSDDLPDPEALEAKFLSQQSGTPKSKPSRKKRGPSLIFRQSLAPGQQPQPQPGSNRDGGDEPVATVALSDGRTISFNPFSLTPGRVDRELEEGGVSRQEKMRVQERVHEEVVRSLRERMERWKV